jgi:hypothetical protein
MNKRSFVFVAVIAALAGCGSGPSALNASALPQSRSSTLAQDRAPGHSWMLKEAASQELVYVSEVGEYNNPGVYVYSYPQGKQVGFLQESSGEIYEGLCADTNGNVWVVGWITNGQAFYTEYAHGGSQPIQDIISVGDPSGCSVDPSTGNLAVANYVDYNISGRRGDIAVWRPGSSKPIDYYDNSIKYYYYCAYDDRGNLYADGNTHYLNVLAKNSKTLRHVYFDKAIVPGSLQWNSGSLVVSLVGGAKGPVHVDRVTVKGSGAHITGTTSLQAKPAWGNYLNVQFWIQGKIITGPGPGSGGPTRTLYFWPYPAGGKATKTIAAPNNGNFYGVAISP